MYILKAGWTGRTVNIVTCKVSHSAHIIWKHMINVKLIYTHTHIYTLAITQGRKKGNVLFINTLNPFYLWLYGFWYMVNNHSDSETGNPLQPHAD